MIRVLIVDDSAFMRKLISDIVDADPEMTVAGTAKDGEMALAQIAEVRPDVVTLDVEMPRMDGLEVLRRLMSSERRIPVVMLSSLTQEGADTTIRALTLGAVDFVPKPSGSISVDLYKVAGEIRQKIKTAAGARVALLPSYVERRLLEADERLLRVRQRFAAQRQPSPAQPKMAGQTGQPQAPEQPASQAPTQSQPSGPSLSSAPPGSSVPTEPSGASVPPTPSGSPLRPAPSGPSLSPSSSGSSIPSAPSGSPLPPVAAAADMPSASAQRRGREVPRNLVVIGCSTGGPGALHQIIPQLPADIDAGILVVQHMPPGFTRSLAERLDAMSKIEVKEAANGDVIQNGVAFLAPGGFHMVVGKDGVLSLDAGPPVHGVRPCVDITMESAARNFRDHCVGVVLTGMGHDGARGACVIKRMGGRTITQDEQSCVVYGMPRSVVEMGASDRVCPLSEIAAAISELF